MRLYLVSEIRHAAERFIEVKRSYHWVEGSLGQALGVLEVPLRLPVHSIEHSWSRGHSPSVSRYRDLLGWVFFFFFFQAVKSRKPSEIPDHEGTGKSKLLTDTG